MMITLVPPMIVRAHPVLLLLYCKKVPLHINCYPKPFNVLSHSINAKTAVKYEEVIRMRKKQKSSIVILESFIQSMKKEK